MFRYGLIRVLPPGLGILVAALVVILGVGRGGESGAAGVLDPVAAWRVTLFGTLGGLLLAVGVWRAAAAGRDLAERDRAWLLVSPTAPLGPLAGYLAGLATAWTLVCAGLGLGAWLSITRMLPAEALALHEGRVLPGPELMVLGPDTPTEAWQVEDPSARLTGGGTLSLVVRSMAGEGPSGELGIALERDGARTEVAHRVAGTRRVLAELPAAGSDPGPLTLRLSHRGGTPLALASAEARLHPPASGRSSEAGLTLHLWLLGLAALGLALGLGAWLRPLVALLATLSLGLTGLVLPLAWVGWSPFAPWLDALAAAAEGWVPAWPPAGALVAAAVASGCGLLLTRAGLSRGSA